jgi:hypothetical protein
VLVVQSVWAAVVHSVQEVGLPPVSDVSLEKSKQAVHKSLFGVVASAS